MLYNGVTQQAVTMSKAFCEYVRFPPGSYVIARSSLTLYRCIAEQAFMSALAPSEHAWNFICGALSFNPAKSAEASAFLQKLRDKMNVILRCFMNTMRF